MGLTLSQVQPPSRKLNCPQKFSYRNDEQLVTDVILLEISISPQILFISFAFSVSFPAVAIIWLILISTFSRLFDSDS